VKFEAPLPLKPVSPIEVRLGKSLSALAAEMAVTGFQGRALGRTIEIVERLARDPDVTIFLGVAGSVVTAGQSKILEWLIERGFVDVLVSTGANISEDLIEALGFQFYHCPDRIDDRQLRDAGFNRYHDICVRESDYLLMIDVIADFMKTLTPGRPYSTREFLQLFGAWLRRRGTKGIVATADASGVPVFCPALLDSAYGDAALVARRQGFPLVLDAAREHYEFTTLGVDETAAIYIGGGVPKDFIQTLAVSAHLLYPGGRVLGRTAPIRRPGFDNDYCPHKYAVQITTDTPQWGGLSGATFEEGVSWGKQADNGNFIQCHCDATICLPLIAHALAERHPEPRAKRRLSFPT
jgi:deoxyhypusine synthase